jgi:N-acetylmuramoyl-L-alanine amidase
VFPDGKIEQLLPESEVSNGVQGYNSTSINIAYVGGIDNKGRAIDNRTEAQKDSLRGLLLAINSRYPNAHIMGHRDIWGKDSKKWKKMCPCFDAEAEYANIYTPDYMDKYEDATGEDENGNEWGTVAHPEIYVYDKPRDYTGFAPWIKRR